MAGGRQEEQEASQSRTQPCLCLVNLMAHPTDLTSSLKQGSLPSGARDTRFLPLDSARVLRDNFRVVPALTTLGSSYTLAEKMPRGRAADGKTRERHGGRAQAISQSSRPAWGPWPSTMLWGAPTSGTLSEGRRGMVRAPPEGQGLPSSQPVLVK